MLYLRRCLGLTSTNTPTHFPTMKSLRLIVLVGALGAWTVDSSAGTLATPFGISFQVNVNAAGQNIPGDAANEPSMCIDPTNPNRMAVGWRQFDSISSSFRQSGYAFTTNGGLNWTFPGRVEAGNFRSDPVLASDADGVFYYLGIFDDTTFA